MKLWRNIHVGRGRTLGIGQIYSEPTPWRRKTTRSFKTTVRAVRIAGRWGAILVTVAP